MRVLNTLQLYGRMYVVYVDVYRVFSVDCCVPLGGSLRSSRNPLTVACCIDTNHCSKYMVDFIVPKGSIRTLIYKPNNHA
jgi:hypothetical protein